MYNTYLLRYKTIEHSFHAKKTFLTFYSIFINIKFRYIKIILI